MPRPKYREPSDFFKNAEPCTVVEEVRQEIAAESAKHIIDPAELRRRQNWSSLLGQVVGGEYPR